MSIISPQEYTVNALHHQVADIENNMYEDMKNKLKVYNRRLCELEATFNGHKREHYIEDVCGILGGTCMWILIINISVKVFV